MRKLYIAITFAALPFLLVWMGFILTGFAFNPYEVFQNGNFWGVSIIYWFMYVCLIGFIIEMVDEDIKLNHNKTNNNGY